MENPPVLEVRQLTKTYRSGDRELTVLKEVSFSLSRAARPAPSSGRRAAARRPCSDCARVWTGRRAVRSCSRAWRWTTLDEDARARVRNEHTGFVFQNFQLVPTLTALENVMVPAELRAGTRRAHGELTDAATELLSQVGLESRRGHYPTQLSGGEQQRVALARAFINRPRLLFADEPTGNLDAETSERVVELILNLNSQAGTALVLVTHNPELAARTGRTIRLRDGAMVD